MTRVRFAPGVPDELAAAVLWYEARRQGLGREFLDEVQATLPLVDKRPRSFPRLQDVDATLSCAQRSKLLEDLLAGWEAPRD